MIEDPKYRVKLLGVVLIFEPFGLRSPNSRWKQEPRSLLMQLAGQGDPLLEYFG